MTESACLYCYRFGRFQLQPSERRLLAAGTPVVLEPRAFDVLVVLIERAGHLVTKDELFRQVWPRLVVEENNLHVQVSALRKVLGPAAIETVPGQGYRFKVTVSAEVLGSSQLATATQNCAALATNLLQSNPGLKLLPSSCEPLDVSGESRYPIPEPPVISPRTAGHAEAYSTTPTPPKEVAPLQLSTRPRRRFWIMGGVGGLLVALTSAWFLQTIRTAPLLTIAAEPPTLSIAILPFTATPDEQLAQILLPEITDAFGRNARSVQMASPTVIASYKGDVDARAIGRELNVRYVAEGDIHSTGDARFLTVRLVDAASGAQRWSERFTIPNADLPTDYGVFTWRVGMHIWLAMFQAERDRAAQQSPASLSATDLWFRGLAVNDGSLNGVQEARKLYERALQLDPRMIGAMLNLGMTYEWELDANPQADSSRLRRDLDELSLRAIATDRSDPRAWDLRAIALTKEGRWEEVLHATAELQQIEPYRVSAFAERAQALIALGRPGEALAETDRGLGLDPFGPDGTFLLRQKCKAYSLLGQVESAIATCEKAATLKEMPSPYVFLTALYAQRGDMDKSAAAKTRLLNLAPGFSVARFMPANGAPNSAWLQEAETYVIPGLRKAGIPEK